MSAGEEVQLHGFVQLVQRPERCHVAALTDQQGRQVQQQFIHQALTQQRAIEFVTGFDMQLVHALPGQVGQHRHAGRPWMRCAGRGARQVHHLRSACGQRRHPGPRHAAVVQRGAARRSRPGAAAGTAAHPAGSRGGCPPPPGAAVGGSLPAVRPAADCRRARYRYRSGWRRRGPARHDRRHAPAGEVIHWLAPLSSAVFPSSDAATLSRTQGVLRSMRLKKPRLISRASSAIRPTSTR